jgi:hypothetical protein
LILVLRMCVYSRHPVCGTAFPCIRPRHPPCAAAAASATPYHLQEAPRKRKTLEQKRAVVLDKEEKKAATLLQQLNAIRCVF